MISVVIPAFNAEETIERALDSVLGQSHRDLEVIVVDDGSSDGTAEIVDFFARRDSRVQLIRNVHGGPGAARNAGIEAARGEWVAFLDADDEYASRAFEAALERVGTQDVGLVIFSITTARGYIYAWPPAMTTLEDRLYPGDGDRSDAFIREYHRKKQMLVYSQCNKLYRRSTLLEHHIRFPEHLNFGEDRLFNFAYLRHAGTVLTMSDALLTYHHGRPGTLSTSFAPGRARVLLELSNAKMSLYRDYGYTDADLEEFRDHDARQFLSEVTSEFTCRDRIGGAPLVRQGLRELLADGLDPRLLKTKAAATRRVRLVQYALRTRQPHLIAGVVHMLRRSEDRQVLQARAREIDRNAEIERLGLTDADPRERARYWYLADYEHFLDRINPEHSRNLLRDKAILLRRLNSAPAIDFLRRNWIDLRRASPDEFAAFLRQHDRVVAKLFNGTWSNGTEVIDVSTAAQDAGTLYDQLVSNKQYVVEGFLEQHAELARVYAGALTSLRIHTLNLGGSVRVVLPTAANFGSRGGDTSNAWTILAFVDMSSGEIITDGLYQGYVHRAPDEQFERHPDSGVPFRESMIPFAEETRRLVLESAQRVPEVPFIGWDVAYSEAGPVIIEGNAAPMIHYSWQIASRRLLGKHGMRADFDEILERFTRFERSEQQPQTQPRRLQQAAQ